ncbi:MAG: hypothetical protein IV101_16560 [Dechloromonas sp.]|nr:hypothetical protein [Dechloromonas sp.]
MNSARRIALLLLALANTPSFAEEAPLGRLFLDPQQRARLDAQRQHNPGFQPNAGEGEASQTINGEVRSSNGRRTRWINGEADWDSTAPPPRVPVGDTFNPATGERESVIGSGRIEIKRGGSTK